MIEGLHHFIANYRVVLTPEQQLGAGIYAFLFILFSLWCGRRLALCLIVGLVVYFLGMGYAINDNNLQFIKADFYARHS